MGSSSEMQIFISDFSRTFLSFCSGIRMQDLREVPSIAWLNKPLYLEI